MVSITTTRKLVVGLEEITKQAYDDALKDTTRHWPMGQKPDETNGFLYHNGDGYVLVLKRGNKYFTADRGFDWKTFNQLKLEDVEYDPIAVYVEEVTEERKSWKPGEPKPDEGTPAAQIGRIKSQVRQQPKRKAS
jgi:hypothetical protein